jgi:hypothetical protein
MTTPTKKDCRLVSKALETALLELERLSELSGSVPLKSAIQAATDEPVARRRESTH